MRNILALKERPGEEAPTQIYGWRPYALAFSASWASAMYGYDSAFIGGTLNLSSFQATFSLERVTKQAKANLSSNIVSTFQAGAFFGSATGFFLAEKYGRKLVIMGSAVIFTIGAIFQMIGRLDLLYAGRVFTGLRIGASAMILPIYVSECSPPLIRGRLVSMFEVMLQVALVFGFWVNYGVNKNISPAEEKQWHVPVAVQFVPAGLLVLCMIPMIESPRWLVLKGKNEAAARALSWAIEGEVTVTGSSRNWGQIGKEVFARGVRGRIIISCAMMVFQNFTGINAINYYSPTIFTLIGFTGTSNGLLATGIFGIIKMIATILYAGYLIDRVGRRKLLLVGGVGAGIAMFYLAGYSQISHSFERTPPLDSGARAAVAMVYIYALFYGLSWNGVPWLFCSEVLPTRVRTAGMAFCVCIQWLTQFVIVYSLPHMVLGIKYGTFLFFGCCTVLAVAFAWCFVPETKGVQLEDMDLIFGPDVSIMAGKAMHNYEVARSARAVIFEEKRDVVHDEATTT